MTITSSEILNYLDIISGLPTYDFPDGLTGTSFETCLILKLLEVNGITISLSSLLTIMEQYLALLNDENLERTSASSLLNALIAKLIDTIAANGGGGGGGPSEVVGYSTNFTNIDLSGGQLTINHNLGTDGIVYTLFDNNFKQIFPDDVTIVNDNTLTINLSLYAPIAGTWLINIIGK